MSGDVFGRHNWGQGCEWHPAGGGHEGYSVFYSARGSTLPQRAIQPGMASMPRSGNTRAGENLANFRAHINLLGIMVKAGSDSLGHGWGPRFLTSNKLPGEAAFPG